MYGELIRLKQNAAKTASDKDDKLNEKQMKLEV